MVDFAQKMERFYLLSGTPAPNGEQEYYRQIQAIDYYGIQPSYSKFKQYYFANLSYNPQYEDLVLRPDKKDEFFNMIKQYAIYVDKEDVLETPGRTFEPVLLEMPNDLKQAYNDVKNKLYLEFVENGEQVTITAPSVATKLGKLNQITSGFIINTKAMQANEVDDGERKELYDLHAYRFMALMTLLSKFDKQEQVIIWAHFRHEFDILQDLLNTEAVSVHGGVDIRVKNEAIQRFKQRKVKYLLANPASADKGLTLTNCHINIYFSLGYSYETFKQSAERIYGDKSIQPYHCMYYIMMAKGTIDEVIYNEVLQGKKQASAAVLNHLKAGN
jgi:SNF2 family DNA or RNA helicase